MSFFLTKVVLDETKSKVLFGTLVVRNSTAAVQCLLLYESDQNKKTIDIDALIIHITHS